MALENLKSVFSEEAGVNKSKISGRYDTDVRVEPMESNFGERTSAVDFFTGENSYKPTLNPAVSGFTKFFNLGGYSFGEGQSVRLNFAAQRASLFDKSDGKALATEVTHG